MPKITHFVLSLVWLVVVAAGSAFGAAVGTESSGTLWRDPGDIAKRDLFYGSGGEKHAPHGPFTFEKEDLDGTNPKFNVVDAEGTRWKVKLGEEARPETAATRFVWAVGYFTDDDYFLPQIKVGSLPAHLKRGQNMVGRDGLIQNVRLERHIKGQEKVGEWKWREDPMRGSREFNGLRVMMALINNWDLKDENNSIYETSAKEGAAVERLYVVSDLGATFGTPGRSVTRSGKGNLKAYEHSPFLGKVTPDMVNFKVPSRPALIHIFEFPEYVRRLKLEQIGKNIPEADARWMGQMLGHLSHEQIESAFRAAGYSKDDADGFTKVVENRIAELNKL